MDPSHHPTRRFFASMLTSLARLLAAQGKRDEARAMLAGTYGWFTEGLDTWALPLIKQP